MKILQSNVQDEVRKRQEGENRESKALVRRLGKVKKSGYGSW